MRWSGTASGGATPASDQGLTTAKGRHVERPCMTEDELALWRLQAEYVRKWGATNTDDPCFDCTLVFAEEMRAIGRCNGTPGVAEPTEPMDLSEARRSSRRESNKRCQQRWRERHREQITERRRAYFAEWKRRKRSEVAEQASGAA